MRKLLNTRFGSFHTRARKLETRWGIGKGDMSYMLHVGKRSFYFYPMTCERPIRPNNVFA